MTTTYQYAHQQFSWEKAAPPRVIAIPKGYTNAKLCASLRAMAETMLKGTGQAQPWPLRFAWGTSFGQHAGEEIHANESECCIPTNTVQSSNKPALWVDLEDPQQARHLKDTLLPTINKDFSRGGGRSAKGQTSLQQCLIKNGEREQLSQQDTAYCRKCKDHQRQFKTLSIWSAPEIFIIHLKRFGRESHDAPLKKIESAVDFLPEMDLGPYMSEASRGADTMYDLYAIINHIGGCSGGHYTAFAKITAPAGHSGDSGDWFEFNDSRVSREREAPNSSIINQEHAYVLFYRKRPSGT
mmetsp:Transcript_26212/g.45593  ORF Transcript_26212/g.45593 Transcript_26212/m.45593 type:complete len:297 (+) Transcript_26212:2-892(+)